MTKTKDLVEKLKILTAFPACSGNEAECALWLKNELKSFLDEVYIDSVGNVIATKGKPEVAIFSHIDKVGYMVSNIQKGFVYAVPLSKAKAIPPEGKKWDILILAGEKVIKGKIFSSNDNLLLDLKDLSDIGQISIGDFVVLAENFKCQDQIVTTQGLDNKLGILAALETFEKAKNITFVASVKEEAFKLGAKVAAWNLKPKKAIVLDVTYDQCLNPVQPVVMGSGPAICLKDNLLPDKMLVKQLQGTAKRNKIPCQLEVLESGSSDAGAIYDLFDSIPFVFIGIPIQNMHSPNETMDVCDLEETINLLTYFLKEHYE